ncbi:MAG TPA: hypothetical protein ACFYD6_03205 [Candidatus Brocadiia bacterium]|nr:hypothetical protein [Candidatus Brocadiales bacterium]
MKMRMLLLRSLGIVALFAMVSCPLSFTFANGDDDDDCPKVRSSIQKGQKCKTQNNFKTSDDVRAKGEHFQPLTNVDIYVTENRKWNQGDPISDVSTDGVETVATDSNGKFSCPIIWGDTLIKGSYDIVVDANQSGTFDKCTDAVDGKSQNPGFKVR